MSFSKPARSLVIAIAAVGFLTGIPCLADVPVESFSSKLSKEMIQQLSKSAEQDTQSKMKEQMLLIGYNIALISGCWESDATPLTASKKPSETALGIPGTLYYVASGTPGQKDAVIGVQGDACETDPQTGKINLHEFYCAAVGNGKVMMDGLFPCRTGTVCKNGACVPTGWNGCFVGQNPFLDTDKNGEPDSCICPEGAFPADSDNDGNSDKCEDREKICSAASPGKNPDVVQKASGKEDGGWTLMDYCSSPFQLTSTVCATSGVKSTSTNDCNPGQICVKGNCVDTDSDLCDNSSANLDAHQKGWVTINTASVMQDKCGATPDTVYNVFCTSPTDSSVGYLQTPCLPNETCDDGICIPKPGSTGPDGGEKKPQTPKAAGSETSSPTPCIPTTTSTCAEPSDSTHPKDPDTGMLLYGDPSVFGTTELTVKVSACPGASLVPDVTTSSPDACSWLETDLLPILTQYGCEGDAVMNSSKPCNWTKGEACDWQATGDDKKGVCKKTTGKAKVTVSGGSASGTNAFGHPVQHQNECVPAQGKKAIKKWKAADSPEGAVSYLESCADLHHCENGVCVADPCFQKNPNDNNPCTADSCDPGTGDIYNFPLDTIDDNNPCTTDTCAAVGGKAVVTHTPMTTGNCSGWGFCQQNPKDPTCQAVDCTKTPDNPKCPPSGGFSCDDPAKKDDPQCQTTLDYCIDDDTLNDVSMKGAAVVFPGTPNEKMASDTCVEYNKSIDQYTAVLQVSCGPNLTFHYDKTACPPNTNGCKNGACEPK